MTKHGVSPRILQAKVVGTRGSSTVTGQQLQSIFGLQTTFAAFTTITTSVDHGILTGTLFPARNPRVGCAADARCRRLAHADACHALGRRSVHRDADGLGAVPGLVRAVARADGQRCCGPWWRRPGPPRSRLRFRVQR